MKKLFKGAFVLFSFLVFTVFLLSSCNVNKNHNKVDNSINSEEYSKIDSSNESSNNEKIELNVSAATSLRDVMSELEEIYFAENRKVHLNFNYASSGALQKQIEEGADVDLFISAGKKQVEDLKKEKLTKENSEVDLLGNSLVLIAASDSDLDIKDFNDLLRDDIKLIAIGEESVPVGQYTRKVLQKLNLWDKVEKKASLAQDVRAVLAWVEEKTKDLGFVYATDAAISDRVKVLMNCDNVDVEPVTYAACLIKNSSKLDSANKFFDFIKSEEAKVIFEKYGFKFLINK